MGPGSAAYRRRGAALRPGHGSVTHFSLNTRFRVLAAYPTRALRHSPPPKNAEGAGKTGCRPGTHGPLCERWQQEIAQRHTGEAKHPAFPAQWFDGLCRALPGERCTIAPVALPIADMRARLGRAHHDKTRRTDPGRQDHTILPYACCSRRKPPCKPPSRRRCPRPPRPTPRVVTIAIRPSDRAGMSVTCDNSKFA
jgi:hypothetical protein